MLTRVGRLGGAAARVRRGALLPTSSPSGAAQRLLVRAFRSPRRLRALEQEANAHAASAAPQAAYLRELNAANHPEHVLQRVESGAFATGSDGAMKEYIKALVATGRLDQANLQGLGISASAPMSASSMGMSPLPPPPAHMHPGAMGNAMGASSGQSGFGAGMGMFGSNSGGAAGAAYAGAGDAAGAMPPPVMVKLVQNERTTWEKVLDVVKGVLPFVFISGVLIYAMGGMDGQLGGGKKGSGLLGMLSPKELEPLTSDVTFDDVKGCDEAKGELQEIADFLADPDRFTSLGGKLPKGVLLMGAPGTGKTLLARAIAGEAGVPFYYVSGAEFDEIFVGVGAKRVRELFRAAKANSPCIIFIDELDAVGGKRSAKDQRAMKQTVNQLLVELDGFEENDGLIVVGATNFPDSLDPALIRPGRFDRHVNVALPDIRGRKAILDLYMEKVTAACDDAGNRLVDTETLARGTPGMSGAELANLINAAAIKASTDGDKAITQAHLEFARDKILMGAERTSAFITPENKKLTAYHEGGHAVVMLHTAGANKIHKATIMPRGRALGMVQHLQKGDQTGMTRKEMRAHIDVCMGGRVAEEIIFGRDEVTTGASSDFKQATNVAKQMVMLYGMSDRLGPMNIDPEQLYSLSDELRHAIDDEVMRLTSESYARVRKLLTKKRGDLEKVAQGLLKYETLTGDELTDLVDGKTLAR